MNYQDCYCIFLNNPRHYSVDYLAGLLFTSIPGWIHRLLAIRNFIVSFFGLKGGDIGKIKKPDSSVSYPKGSKIVLFTVYDRNEHEIVMAEDDKHLNFRTSVMIEEYGDKNKIKLYSSTIVHYNNIWGRFYFLFVKPFHQLICKTILKILLKNIDAL